MPNPGFESVTGEPYWGCEFDLVNDWINPSGLYCFNNNAGTPDIFSRFATGQAILPNSFMGTTQPHTGDRCTGIVTYHQQLANYREYMMVPLNCALVPGNTYTVSFWTTGGNPVQYIYHSNNIEICFTTNALSQTGYNVIASVTPQYTISTLITNSSWTYYSFQFTPTQAFTYMTIGNFKTDANTQVQAFGTNRPYAYFFFDDVSVVPSNSSSFLGGDTTFCGNFSHTLNSNDPNTTWSTGAIAQQITVTTPGTYWATKAGGCGTITDTIVITQAQPLSPFTLGTDTTYCGNFTRVLSTGNSSTVWSTGATASQITVSAAGSYWARQTNQCNTVSDTIVLSQTNPPQFSLPNDTALCPNDSLQLTVTSGSNISWSNGATASSIWVSSPGLYWAEAYNVAGCTRRDSIVITQAQPLSPFTLGTDTTYCGNFTRVLSTGNSSTVWSTGATASQITVSAAGTYWARQTNQCNTVSDTIVLSQTTPPQFSLPNDTALCPNDSLQLTVTSGSNVSWSNGATASSIWVSSPGLYWAEAYNVAGCTRRDSIVITQAQPLSPFMLGTDTTYCGNFTRVLSTGNSSTVWSTGATASQITVSAAGTYWARQTNQCNTVSDTIVLSQTTPPQFSLPNDTALCPNDSLQLTVTSGSNISWSNGATASSIWVSSPGLYWAEAYNVAGCARRDSIVVTQVQPLSVFIGNDTTYCGNFNRVLASGNASTVWSTGVTGSQITVSTAGVYWASLSNQCYTAGDTIILTQVSPPSFNLPSDTSLCTGDSVLLSVTAGSNVVWSNSSTVSSIWVSVAGIYWAEAFDIPGCSQRDSIVVTQDQIASLNLGADTTFCSNSGFILRPGIAGAQYVWNDNTTDSFYVVMQSGTYSVTATNGCGSATDNINITYLPNGCQLAIPTAFSPNGDGKNDLFRAVSYCAVPKFTMRVYNRWGELVFETVDITEGWNGVFRNTQQPMGVFVYYIEYFNDCSQKKETVAGNVTLLR